MGEVGEAHAARACAGELHQQHALVAGEAGFRLRVLAWVRVAHNMGEVGNALGSARCEGVCG